MKHALKVHIIIILMLYFIDSPREIPFCFNFCGLCGQKLPAFFVLHHTQAKLLKQREKRCATALPLFF